MNMKANEVTIITTLEEKGYEAYRVGGCVRDELLGLPVMDIDITTNATPDEMADIFKEENLNFAGKVFGVMIINGIEVATFRSETYERTGKPDVELVGSFLEDASRRDFTINAMGKNRDGGIIDYFGGKEDLARRMIRAVGKPLQRFQEDPSRILRGVYLASYLGFDIEKDTRRTMKEHADLLLDIPVELIGRIIMKVIKRNCLSEFLLWVKELELFDGVFPYLNHMVGLPQNPKYHNLDVFMHIVRVVQSAERRYPSNVVMLLSALYHDVAKGLPGVRGTNGEGQPSDLTHEGIGVPIAKEAMQTLQFPRKIVDSVLFNVEYHGLRLPERVKKRSVLKAIRKMIPYFSTKEELKKGVKILFQFMECDADGFEPSFGTEMQRVSKIVWSSFEEVLEETIFYRAELPINGQVVMQYGFQGKQIGDLMDEMVDKNLQTEESIKDFLERKVKRRESDAR
jgi:tRNA nucleotidyltransferase (CCA-adding enzyme)